MGCLFSQVLFDASASRAQRISRIENMDDYVRGINNLEGGFSTSLRSVESRFYLV